MTLSLATHWPCHRLCGFSSYGLKAHVSTVTSLLDYYLPLMTVTRHTTDKPWVTDQFRYLIYCRQYALKNGHTVRYNAYRNRVQRMSRT